MWSHLFVPQNELWIVIWECQHFPDFLPPQCQRPKKEKRKRGCLFECAQKKCILVMRVSVGIGELEFLVGIRTIGVYDCY